MAIRSGTGGLKYPLPVLAQIQAQQNAASASAGGSASASAYGTNRQFAANRMRIQADLANAAANRQFQGYQQAQDQNFRAQQAYIDRENQMGSQLSAQQAAYDRQQAHFQQQNALQQSGQQFAADQNILQQTAQSDRDLRLYNQQLVAGLTPVPEHAQEQTRRHLQKLASGLQEMTGQGYDPRDPSTAEQFNEAYQSYNSIVQSIPKPSQAERGQRATTFYNPQTGQFSDVMKEGFTPGVVNNDNQFQPHVDQSVQLKEQQKQQQDQQKEQQRQLAENKKLARDLQATIDPDTGKPYTAERAAEKVMEDDATHNDVFNAQPPAAPAPRPEQQQVTGNGARLTAAGQAAPQPGQAAAVPGALPDAHVQSVVSDIRNTTQNLPIDPKTETPQLRNFLDKNMEDIVRYSNVPPDQVPEAARPAVDFYGRYMQSHMQGKPIVLRTPDEKSMLPPDTPYIDDQGNERRTAKKKAQ